MSYNPLPSKGEIREDESTERDSFEGGPRLHLCHSCQRQTRLRRRLTLISTILIPLLLLLILLLVAYNTTQTTTVRSSLTRPTTHKFYGNDQDYMSLDHKYDHLWTPNLASDNGAIDYPLHPGGANISGGIGMFHQLHCLAGFRRVLQRAREGEKIGIDDRDDPHWPHCFHYMRQAVHCAADSTIERERFRNGSIGAEWINGQWDVRVCGDSEALYKLRDTYKGVEKPEQHH